MRAHSAGKLSPWAAAAFGKRLVSVATDYQEELGLRLGDRLTFDIAGGLPGNGSPLPATASLVPDVPPTVVGVVQQADADVRLARSAALPTISVVADAGVGGASVGQQPDVPLPLDHDLDGLAVHDDVLGRARGRMRRELDLEPQLACGGVGREQGCHPPHHLIRTAGALRGGRGPSEVPQAMMSPGISVMSCDSRLTMARGAKNMSATG